MSYSRTKFVDLALSIMGESHDIRELDLGSEASVAKRGFKVELQAWEVEGIGHLCDIRMRLPLRLMRMETIVFAPIQVDMPLMNLDWISAFGSEIQFVEIYDDQLSPWPEEEQRIFETLQRQAASLPDAKSVEGRWYDDILYPFSVHKAGRKISRQLEEMAYDYLVAYLDQCLAAPPCDAQAKEAKVGEYARRLFAEGGPAVDAFVKLFGTETARRVVVQNMYGVKEG